MNHPTLRRVSIKTQAEKVDCRHATSLLPNSLFQDSRP